VPAVRATDVQKAYGGTTALAGLDLEISAGTVHGLLGPNGAGKTTLLRALLGLVRLDAGTVQVAGRVGGFAETPGAYPYLTGRENLAHLAALDSAPGDVDDVLRRVDLLDRADTRVRGWSLGMRQRLGIAAGLLRRPDLLVLDEPANGLDPASVRSLRGFVRELAADGVTVLLSSHDLAEVAAVADELTVIARGRRVWSGTVAELAARPQTCAVRTSDDAAATSITVPGIEVDATDGLRVSGDARARDAWVLALARAGIAVRELAPVTPALEDAFLELTR
jgi:ABC-2 type transport system ATP-binding protein